MAAQLTRRRFLAAAAAAVGTVGGVACLAAPQVPQPGQPQPTQPAADQRLPLGELSLVIRADPWQLSVLSQDGQPLWSEAPDQTFGYRTPDGKTYRAQRLVSSSTPASDTARMVVATDDPSGSTLSIEVRALGPRALRVSIAPDAPAAVAAVMGGVLSSPDEHFLGLGERFDRVDQRGRQVQVWAEDRRVANYGASTYAPLPLLLSSRGYSFALERFERSQFDLAAARPDRWSWQQEAPEASLVLTYGPTLKELVQRNAQVFGLPPLPPAWLFGVWKTSVGGQDAVIAEMQRLRELHVPVSAVFTYDAVDATANLGWPVVTFGGRSAGDYPDPKTYTATLHGLGIKALDYFSADFHLDRSNYQEPASHGFLVKRQDGRVYVDPRFNVAWLDVSDPDAVQWWSATWRRALSELGYDGGMLDLGELIPADAVFGDGTTGLQTHNRYPLLYAQSAWQAASAIRPDGDFALLLRSGAVGAQRWQSGQWDGDAVMRWQGPDGLQSMVPAGLSFGLSGFPYWHAEVAGYVQADLDHDQERELWLRWLQLGTWTSLLRDHLGDQPRSPVEVWSDDVTLEAFKQAAAVHASLLPYLYSLAAEASRTGLPLIRHLAMEVPDDPRAWQEEQSYFLGPLFLVAPVVQSGATTRTVYLPAGEWVDYWTGTLYQGGQEVTVPAPLDRPGPPVFARAGAMLPLAPEYDSLVPASDLAVRTWNGDLVVRVLPGGQGQSSFTLYDGTQLHWTGAALEVSANARPRTIDLRVADRPPVVSHVEGASVTISPSGSAA